MITSELLTSNSYQTRTCKPGHIRANTTGCHIQPVASKRYRSFALFAPRCQNGRSFTCKQDTFYSELIPSSPYPEARSAWVSREPARIVTARKPPAGRMLSRLQAASRHLSDNPSRNSNPRFAIVLLSSKLTQSCRRRKREDRTDLSQAESKSGT